MTHVLALPDLQDMRAHIALMSEQVRTAIALLPIEPITCVFAINESAYAEMKSKFHRSFVGHESYVFRASYTPPLTDLDWDNFVDHIGRFTAALGFSAVFFDELSLHLHDAENPKGHLHWCVYLYHLIGNDGAITRPLPSDLRGIPIIYPIYNDNLEPL